MLWFTKSDCYVEEIPYLCTIYSAVSVSYSLPSTSASALMATFVSPISSNITALLPAESTSILSHVAWRFISKAILCFLVYKLLKAQHHTMLRLWFLRIERERNDAFDSFPREWSGYYRARHKCQNQIVVDRGIHRGCKGVTK